ncbi:MAG TPA: restriction endonuclease subunit R [Candidatus Limnocylindria bacterium]|nr:restriction endonuclease subunit R [Candidatus Limnocylindria bacterium]
MTQLHEALETRVRDWRAAGYPTGYAAIGEIFAHAVEGEVDGRPFPASGSLRYLRAAQYRALEVYWYLRLVAGTPRVPALYAALFPRPSDRLEALGLGAPDLERIALDDGLDGLLSRIAGDPAFAARHDLDALRESFVLEYPSWILALAMGAGKTVLIGAIVATEFAMAIEYPRAELQFVENALVFAPGKTIIESLRELARIPYERLLPPRLLKPFLASFKLTFTRDGDPDIPVIRGSSFNLVVTNTEKIRIQARPVRRKAADQLRLAAAEEQERELANLRLRTIASLPHLAVFSDEAHHTYGQGLAKELKRVRETVDYLAARSPNLICVVNTTGTPYFGRQPLRDVVVWYGLGQGIADGILKEVAGNIRSYDVGPDLAADFVTHVVTDFFSDYRDVALPDGAPAKLAVYFPQTDDLDELRPLIELALAAIGIPPAAILTHTSKTGKDAEDAFNRLSDPASSVRVVLLVNKGTEGWNCPSLFATALARKLSSANNFVLQAASRCLRQVPGNHTAARIYLSKDNQAILDRQLQETYRESIADLDRRARESRRDVITLTAAKLDAPPVVVRRPRRTVRRVGADVAPLRIDRPAASTRALIGSAYDIGPQVSTRRLLQAVGDEIVVERPVDSMTQVEAAVHLAAVLRLDLRALGAILRAAYGSDDVPVTDLPVLQGQLEAQSVRYEVDEADEEASLRILKPEGFDPEPGPDGPPTYTAEITYPVDRSDLVFGPERMVRENERGYGFHYTPYNFDTHPEASYFEQLVRLLNRASYDVADIYFTGAITAPSKTDLAFSYRRIDGKVGYYTPDFLVRCRDDRWLFVEVKREAARIDPIEGLDGRKAASVRDLVAQNRDRLDYLMVFTASDAVLDGDLAAAKRFAETCRA